MHSAPLLLTHSNFQSPIFLANGWNEERLLSPSPGNAGQKHSPRSQLASLKRRPPGVSAPILLKERASCGPRAHARPGDQILRDGGTSDPWTKIFLLVMSTATIDYLEYISYTKAVLRRKEIQVDASDNQGAAAAARRGRRERTSERASARAA